VQTLEDHAGEVQELGPKGIRDIKSLTHIISSTSDFREYSAAREVMIAVITPSWITSSLLRNKQAPIRPYTPDPLLFFSQINLTCADIPTGDKDAIVGAVLAMGGVESSSLTKLTTHICALTMDNQKCQQAKDKKLKCKIVLPHWYACNQE
jgi:twin BRCT domain